MHPREERNTTPSKRSKLDVAAKDLMAGDHRLKKVVTEGSVAASARRQDEQTAVRGATSAERS
jgi:hypothetical protein